MWADLGTARERLFRDLRRNIVDQRVITAMEQVPRELFVPPESSHLAYEDIPLPVGEGQTISQPYIVAVMTQALELQGRERVLEVGTGSGYQAAILARLCRRVVSVERVPSLLETAQQRLEQLGYTNMELHPATDSLGWPPGAPYDAIAVTAGAPSIPQSLLDQMAVGGRLVIPVGSRYEQDLLKVVKGASGLQVSNLGACRFVPLVGEGAWSPGDLRLDSDG
ncbi:MAG: protein-L-isoaspartate(D-aspartate) O-methyltransferase [Chloroflexi bacterium]|nr:protein-L-isoaspartate(D-aspartate) O-methyltransferase [Chloroflexota bacterium]